MQGVGFLFGLRETLVKRNVWLYGLFFALTSGNQTGGYHIGERNRQDHADA